tara:strand:+ start:23579 stop:24598 length:1020 start_codon:yes stop_codon:yes gene_type:complete
MRLFFFLFSFLFIACDFNDNKFVEEKSEILQLSDKIKNNPTNTDFLLDRVVFNINKKNYESALFDINQCIKIDTLNSYFYFLAAQSYFEISKIDNLKSDYPKKALRFIEKSINIEDDNYKYYALYGEIQLAFGRYEQSIDLFNSSLEIEYNQTDVHHLMGYAFKNLDKTDIAINCFRNSINIDPLNVNSYLELGIIYQSNNDTIAIDYYNTILQIDSSDIIALYNMALFYQENMLYNKSLETYSRLLQFDSFNVNTHYNIGFIHMELKLFDLAVNNFADAIYSNSMFFEAYYARGICFETLGNIAQAEVDYRRSIEINPNYQYAIDALNRLNKNNLKYK